MAVKTRLPDHLTEMERRQYEAFIHVDKRGSYTILDDLLQGSGKADGRKKL